MKSVLILFYDGSNMERIMSCGSRLDRVDCGLLTPFVKKALDNPKIRITEWSHQVIKGDGTLAKRLVCRFSGQANLQGKEIPWSIFLKVPNPTHTHLDLSSEGEIIERCKQRLRSKPILNENTRSSFVVYVQDGRVDYKIEDKGCRIRRGVC